MGVPYAEVIGDPIAHSKSPLIHKFWLEKLGHRGRLSRTRLVTARRAAGLFRDAARDEDWRGCNITMPHKIAALQYVHMHRDPSFPVEAVNVAKRGRDGRLEGMNADRAGFLEPLLDAQRRPHGRAEGAAIVVGAGGVLYSIMMSLQVFGYLADLGGHAGFRARQCRLPKTIAA